MVMEARTVVPAEEIEPIEDGGGGGGGYGGGGYGGGGYGGGGGGGYYGGGGGYDPGGYTPGGYDPGGYSPAGYYGGYYGSGYYSAGDYSGDGQAPTKASGGSTTTYTNADGSTYTLTDTIPNRNHNPLDMRGGQNQIGTDNTKNGNFAIFATDADGWAAADHTLSTTYGNTSVNDIISHWTPPAHNDTAGIQSRVDSSQGLSGNETWNSLSSQQQTNFENYYATHVEGFHGKAKGG